MKTPITDFPAGHSQQDGLSAKSTIRAFFDACTKTLSYVVWDHATRRAAVIDPVLDFDLSSGRMGTASTERILAYLGEHDLVVEWILETHPHADHLSSAQLLRARVGGRVAIGADICSVQATFKKVYNLEPQFVADGAQFDKLLKDGETFHIGDLQVTAWHVPGHTPADMAYLVDGAVFVGDTLFMPDVGTARSDFPGGDPRQLYRSIRRLLGLPARTTMYMCHDYPPAHRDGDWQTTVGAQRAHNVHVRDGVTEDEFVRMRTARDSTLAVPALLLPAIQVNVRAGRLPPADDNGVSYLRIPVESPLKCAPGDAASRPHVPAIRSASPRGPDATHSVRSEPNQEFLLPPWSWAPGSRS